MYSVYTQATNPLTTSFNSWSQSGTEVSTAKVNLPVELSIDVYSNSILGYTGNVKFQIKKDVPGGDVIFYTKTLSVSIPPGINPKKTVKISFTPNEKTSGSNQPLGVREYYYIINTESGVKVYNPETQGDRNGLQVADKPAGENFPTVLGILFNDRPQITVSPNTNIITTVKMNGKGSGLLKVEIKSDYQLIGDETYKTMEIDATINSENDVVTLPAWKAITKSYPFRSYFAKVYWNNELIYDPTDPSQREYVKVEGETAPPTSGSISLKTPPVWSVTANGASSVKTTFEVIGTVNKAISIDIRKNVFLSDENIITKQSVITSQGDDVTIETTFTAPSSGSNIFIRVNPGIYDETNPDKRKLVGTEIQVPSTPTVPPTPTPTSTPPTTTAKITFNSVESRSDKGPEGYSINVPQNSWVSAFVTLTTSQMGATGTLKVEVKKDISWYPDEILTTFAKQVTFNKENTMTTFPGSYQATDLTGTNNFHQYFYKVYWNNELIYDPTNPNSRESVTTYK